MLKNRSDDPINRRCGHNFPPLDCPYEHCDFKAWIECLIEIESATPSDLARFAQVAKTYTDKK